MATVTPYVGEIRMFAFQRVPSGWAACDGSLLGISGNEALYTLLGTTYGGDGQTSFGLPDLRSRVPLHQGQGNGLTPRVLGQRSGTETVTLTTQQMPAHTHPVYATTNAANAATPANSVVPGTLSSTDTMYATNVSGTFSFNTAAGAVGVQGGSSPHDNTMPTLTLAYCIATVGLFPSQS